MRFLCGDAYRYTRTKTPTAHVVPYRYTCAYDQRHVILPIVGVSRHPAVFILCRLRLQLKHFLPSLLVRVKFILLSRLEGSTICKSLMGNKILCSVLTVTLIIMCLIFQVAAVSGNKGLAELIANFTERDIGTLMLLWESKVSSWWFHHCVKQFLRVQLNCSFSGVDFGRVA